MAKKDNTILWVGAGAAALALIANASKKANIGSINHLDNFHILKVTYIGPSNTRGSRVKIESERFEQSIYINYDYRFNRSLDMAQEFLTKKGFKLIGTGEGKNCDYLISTTFEPLK